MSGERNLATLLAGLQPQLSAARYEFTITTSQSFDEGMFALIAEEEGRTRVVETPAGEWARISLGVNSSLEAVGLTAAVTSALTAHGISANVIAAFHHDHFFVPWERREEAVELLRGLQDPK